MKNHVDNIIVSNSPVPSPARGNLTGNPRKVRDSVADLYSLIQKWNVNTATGSEVITSIANLKTQTNEGTTDPSTRASLLPNGLEERISMLEEAVQDCGSVVEKMTKMAHQMQAMAHLEQYRYSSASPSSKSCSGLPQAPPLFITWPAERFHIVFDEITNAYQSELKVRQCLLENVAFCPHRDALMFYLTAWSRQVYITDRHRLLLEALLCETGHR